MQFQLLFFPITLLGSLFDPARFQPESNGGDCETAAASSARDVRQKVSRLLEYFNFTFLWDLCLYLTEGEAPSLTSSSSAPRFCSSVSELWVRAITHHVSRSGPFTRLTCPHSRARILWIPLTGMDGPHTPSSSDSAQRFKDCVQPGDFLTNAALAAGRFQRKSRLLHHLRAFDRWDAGASVRNAADNSWE